MLSRFLSLLAASAAAVLIAAVPAHSQSGVPAPNVTAGACTDSVLPHSNYTSRAAKAAKKTRVLKGRASDVGCGLDRVEISVGLREKKHCLYLRSASLFSRAHASCGRPTRWLAVKGTTSWSYRLPKKLKRGTYVVRTRATDFAGNVEHLRSHRLDIR